MKYILLLTLIISFNIFAKKTVEVIGENGEIKKCTLFDTGTVVCI
jgi:hypothetical protein